MRCAPNVIVVDASVLAPIVADGGDDGRRLRRRVRGERLAVPDLARIEVLSVLRRRLSAGDLEPEEADDAAQDLLDLPLVVYPTGPLLRRTWELRHNVSSYDACYVALAEALGCAVLTADGRLSRAPGLRCPVEVV